MIVVASRASEARLPGAWRPLGIAVVGGMLFSQFLTRFITPTFYVSMARIEAALARRRGRPV